MSIFINYRISDCSREAFILYKRLQQDLGVDIFLDKQKVRAGTYWEDEIKQKLLDAQVVLALISSTWLQAKDKSGNLRLPQPNDWVRIEIEQALKEEKLVCVYLKSKEHLPDLKEEDLPKSIQGITKIQNIRLSDESDRYRETDCHWLLQELRYRLKQGIVKKRPDLNEALSISKPKTWLKTSSLRKYLDLSSILPQEVLSRYDNPQEILRAYLRFRDGNKKPLNECGLLVVGNEAVGKTSLLRFAHS